MTDLPHQVVQLRRQVAAWLATAPAPWRLLNLLTHVVLPLDVPRLLPLPLLQT